MMVTILLLSCSDRKEKYNITGRVEGCQDGDSIVLACSPDGMTLESPLVFLEQSEAITV